MSGTQELRSPIQGGFLYQPTEWLLDCSFVEENAAALALGTLEHDEVTRINHHVSWCPVCASLVHEDRKTVNYLPFLSSHASPSNAVKSSLFARIGALQELEQIDSKELWSPIPVAGAMGKPAATDRSSTASKQRFWRGTKRGLHPSKRRLNWELIVAPLAAVPLVVALAIVGGWALRTQDRLDNQVALANDLENQNADLTAQVGWLSNTIDSNEFDLESVDSALGGGAGGSVTANSNKAWAMISVWNLPASATGYQVLLETEDGIWIRALEFTPDPDGSAERELHIDSPLDKYAAIHVQPKQSMDRTSTGDDILWMDLDSNLGSSSGTEANAKAH